MSYLIDIDDTLVSTRKRTQGLWKHVLGCVVPLGEIETMTARQIFERYATEEQKPLMRDLQRRFTETMLCKNVEGVRLMELDEPIPYAANVCIGSDEETARAGSSRHFVCGQKNLPCQRKGCYKWLNLESAVLSYRHRGSDGQAIKKIH